MLDQPDGMPRQLVINEGHSEEVNDVLFASKHEVTIGGFDSPFFVNVISENLECELFPAGFEWKGRERSQVFCRL